MMGKEINIDEQNLRGDRAMAKKPMTLAQKLLANKLGVPYVEPGS